MIASVRVAGALSGLLLVAGCGGASDDARAPRPAPATSPASPTPPVSPSPSAAPAPSPADGTRVAACWDGTCEIAIPGPLRIPLRFGRLSVTKLQPPDVMEFDLTLPGGGGNGTLKGNCGTIAYFNRDFSGGRMSMFSCDPAIGATAEPERPEPQPGEVALQLVGWTPADAAVIRLITG